ncbi:MAG TPA: amino acid ABC transporter permease [Micromonosporaceae bacterium]|jgi:polar amino acid transport system permease protein|nr:amino acid ABC transporter permease [Micromonosporaceae bacterium]
MADETPAVRARAELIKAVPVRHPGRWVAVAVIAILALMFAHTLVTNGQFHWSFMVDNMFRPPIIEGLRGTIVLTIASMALGIVLGVGIGIMRLSDNPILRSVSWVYTWFFRSVPRLVLLAVFGNLAILWRRLELGVPFDRQLGALFGVHDLNLRLFGFDTLDVLTGFTAGILALSLSEAAYMAEIVRAGIKSVDSGQLEAAAALGMSRSKIMRRIVLPQAMRVIVPPTGNETIAMLKDTSLVLYVPISAELFNRLDSVGKQYFLPFPMYVAACLWYLFLTSILLVGQHFVEKRFSRGYGEAARARQHLRDLSAEH